MKAVVEFKKRNVSKRNIEDVRGVVESTNNIYIYYYEKERIKIIILEKEIIKRIEMTNFQHPKSMKSF